MNKTMKPKKIYMCDECNKEIYGDHVKIETRRHTKLHICFECMNRRKKQKESIEKSDER